MTTQASTIENEVVDAIRERVARFEQSAAAMEASIRASQALIDKTERQAFAMRADLATFKDLLTHY